MTPTLLPFVCVYFFRAATGGPWVGLSLVVSVGLPVSVGACGSGLAARRVVTDVSGQDCLRGMREGGRADSGIDICPGNT